MSQTIFDGLVVTSNFRDQQLALSLKERGLGIAVLNVADHQQENLLPLDFLEGPIPLAKDSLPPKAREQFSQTMEKSFRSMPEGIPLWTSKGPIHFHHALTPHQCERMGLNKNILELLMNSDFLDSEKSSPYEESWPLPLSLSWASSMMTPRWESYNKQTFLSVARKDFVQGYYGRKALLTQKNQLQAQDITLLEAEEIFDVQVTKTMCCLVYKSSGEKKKLYYKKALWGLSGQESSRFVRQAVQKTLNLPLIQPTWLWQRLFVKGAKASDVPGKTTLPLGELYKGLPEVSLILQNVFRPFVRDNLIILKKSSGHGDYFSAWYKASCKDLDNHTRNQVESVVLQRLNNVFGFNYLQKISGSLPESTQWRYPTYDLEDLTTLKQRFHKEHFKVLPELAPRLDWASQFAYREELYPYIAQKMFVNQRSKNDSTLHP